MLHNQQGGSIPQLYQYTRSKAKPFARNNVRLKAMLPRDVLVKILSHLGTPRDLFTCSTVCRFFADAASEQELWHELAVLKYGAVVADGTIHLYQGNWKSMVADDNKRGALPTLQFAKPPGKAFYLWTNIFHLMVRGVQWDRQNQEVLVHVDAIGGFPEDPEGFGISSDHGGESYEAKSLKQQVGSVSNLGPYGSYYKGCLFFSDGIFKSKKVKEQSYYLAYRGLFRAGARIELLTGNLGSFGFDHYTLDGPLTEMDTAEVEMARWKPGLPKAFTESEPNMLNLELVIDNAILCGHEDPRNGQRIDNESS